MSSARRCRRFGVLFSALVVAGRALACSTFAASNDPPLASDDGGRANVALDGAAADVVAKDSGAADVVAPDASDSGPAVPPSCAPGGPGMTNCGGDGVSGSESCCTSLAVPGGSYLRSYTTDDAGATTGEADPAAVSSFALDKYEVTVGRFRQFVAAWKIGAGFVPAAGSGKHSHLNAGQGLANNGSAGAYEPGWTGLDSASLVPADAKLRCDPSYATWTAAVDTQENLPINCVTWSEAYAFCIWDGGFLPSEAEWEYAASGGNQQRMYPWGSTPPGTGSEYAIHGCPVPGTAGCAGGVGDIAPVGTATMGAGAWGQLDLAGNVWEWTLDWFNDPYVAASCEDCSLATMGPAGAYRVFRGGDFGNPPPLLIPSYRGGNPPTRRDHHIGIRCARSR